MHMTAAEFSTAVQTLLSLVVLVFIVFSWWPNQRVDIFRQQMFALRDELFDFALSGPIEFDNPAYTQLRDLMNGYIRYAHNLTPYRTKVLLTGRAGTWEQAVKKVTNAETRAKLEEFRYKAFMFALLLDVPIRTVRVRSRR